MLRLRHLVALSFLAVAPLAAQTPAKPSAAVEDSIVGVVTKLFDGMRKLDTLAMRSAFAPGTLLGGVPRAGQPVKFTTVDSWIEGTGRTKAGTVLDEAISNPEVRIDGGLATVWAQYTFKIDGKISHCGVDAFQLVRTSTGWLITALADTRRPCSS